jgi:hypothetical protein
MTAMEKGLGPQKVKHAGMPDKTQEGARPLGRIVDRFGVYKCIKIVSCAGFAQRSVFWFSYVNP